MVKELPPIPGAGPATFRVSALRKGAAVTQTEFGARPTGANARLYMRGEPIVVSTDWLLTISEEGKTRAGVKGPFNTARQEGLASTPHIILNEGTLVPENGPAPIMENQVKLSGDATPVGKLPTNPLEAAQRAAFAEATIDFSKDLIPGSVFDEPPQLPIQRSQQAQPGRLIASLLKRAA